MAVHFPKNKYCISRFNRTLREEYNKHISTELLIWRNLFGDYVEFDKLGIVIKASLIYDDPFEKFKLDRNRLGEFISFIVVGHREGVSC